MWGWLIGENKDAEYERGCQDEMDKFKVEEVEEEDSYIHLNGFAEVSVSFDEKYIESLEVAWKNKSTRFYYFSVSYTIRYTVDDDLKEFVVTGKEKEHVCDIEYSKAIDEVYESIQRFLEDEERMVKMMKNIVRRDFNERVKNENIEKVKKMLKENKTISVGFSTKVKK